MTKEEFIVLAQKYHTGTCSAAERTLYENIYHDFIQDDTLAPTWRTAEKETIKKRIQAHIVQHRKTPDATPARSRGNRIVWQVAASVALVVGIGLTYYFVSKPAPAIPYLTSTTQKGQRSTLTLSDGTLVTLNTESKFSYPEHFTGNRREVFLEGEAFFNVKRNPENPFIVHAGDVVTTVLGTSFNIRAFKASPVEVTVATGKVNVAATAVGKNVSLVKGQQAVYDQASGNITMQPVELRWYTAWMGRTLEFDMMPFSEVIDILARTYNTPIRMGRTNANPCLIRGRYANENLVTVLRGLQYVVDFNYHVAEDGAIVIDGNGCIH